MVTRDLAERLCNVAPERFAFAVVDDGWYASFSLTNIENDSEYDWSLTNHLKQFDETILYASAWALNEMRTWDKDNGFMGLTYSEQIYWLRSQVMNLEVDNLEPITILDLFCEWKETFGVKE